MNVTECVFERCIREKGMLELSFLRTFAPGNESSIGWNFCSLELSFPGTFAPRNESSLELSFPGTFVPWNFHSLEL